MLFSVFPFLARRRVAIRTPSSQCQRVLFLPFDFWCLQQAAVHRSKPETLGQCFRESRLRRQPPTSGYAKYTVTLFSWEDFRGDLHSVEWIWGRLRPVGLLSGQTVYLNHYKFLFIIMRPLITVNILDISCWGEKSTNWFCFWAFLCNDNFSSAFLRNGKLSQGFHRFCTEISFFLWYKNLRERARAGVTQYLQLRAIHPPFLS